MSHETCPWLVYLFICLFLVPLAKHLLIMQSNLVHTYFIHYMNYLKIIVTVKRDFFLNLRKQCKKSRLEKIK